MGKRILNVINSMNPATGGPCEGIRNLIPELKLYGIDSDVICLDDPEEEFIIKSPFTIYALGKSFSPWKYHPQLLQWLIANLPAYDMVMVRGLWLYHSYAVHKALKTLKQKKNNKHPGVYIMPHGMLDPWFQQAGTRRFKALRNLLYWHLIEKKVINNAEGVLFTCLSELKLARRTFADYHPQSEINIGYGIHHPPSYRDHMIRAFTNKCPSVINHSFLLFLGRIDEKKGIDLLIAVYQKLLNNNLRLPKLVIAGPGIESKYGKKIFNIVEASSKLKNHIFFTGMLSGDAKWGAFYGCDAYILPSHQENFGISVVEAMASGKAVLISNRINIYHDIEEAGAGLVNTDSEDGVEYLINTWIGMSEEIRNEMSRRAKELFESRFTIQSAARQMIECIDI